MKTGLLEFVRKNLKLVNDEWVPNETSSIWFYSTIFPIFPVIIALRLNERRKSIKIYKSIIEKK